MKNPRELVRDRLWVEFARLDAQIKRLKEISTQAVGPKGGTYDEDVYSSRRSEY